jgi:hypothetical protein
VVNSCCLGFVFSFAPLADEAKGGDGAKSALRLCVSFSVLGFLGLSIPF